MTINVTGTLIDPLGNPLAEDILRFTSLDQITGSAAEYVSNENGLYDFELELGRYVVEGNYLGNEFHLLGSVTIDEFTPSPVSITDLVLFGSPVVPPIIVETDPDWDQLFADVQEIGRAHV